MNQLLKGRITLMLGMLLAALLLPGMALAAEAVHEPLKLTSSGVGYAACCPNGAG